MKAYKFWIDTETTGIKPEQNQILEYAVIVEAPNGKLVEEIEVKLLLRFFVKPSPEALAANNINPNSPEWIAEAISEEKAAEKLADLCEKYTVGDCKPIFVAYNAQFDVKHIKLMFMRHGISFESCFNQLVIDPLKTVSELVKNGTIKTKKLISGKKSYNSSKLEDVAAALNISTGKPAHRALNDVETMILVSRALYKIVTGKEILEANTSPERYVVGEIKNIVSESATGLKTRHVCILKNNPEQEQVIGFDLSDYERIGLSPSNIRTFNYVTIVDELKVEESSMKKLQDIVSSNKSFIEAKI